MTFRDAAHHIKQTFMRSFKTYLFAVVTVGAACTVGSLSKRLLMCRGHKAEVCLSHFQPILGRLGEADIKVALSDLSEPKRNQESGVGGVVLGILAGFNLSLVNHENAKYKHDDLIILSRMQC